MSNFDAINEKKIDSNNQPTPNPAQRNKEIKNKLFKQERIRLEKTISQIHQAQDLENLFTTLVDTLRKELIASRVLIYRFEDQSKGQVIRESLEPGWTPAWEETLPCLCFGAQTAADYHSGKIVAIADVSHARVTPYQKQLLEKFQVQASLAVPVLLNSTAGNYAQGQVWGLLVAQQCDQARSWQEIEINLVYQIARELTLILQHQEISQKQKQKISREKALSRVVDKIRNLLQLNEIFRTATQEVRQLLQTDRVVIYQFNPDWSGKVIAESVGAGWVSLLVEQEQDEVLTGDRIQTDRCLLRDWSAGEKADIVEPDAFLRETQGGRYTRGQKYTAVADIYGQEFPECYIQSLEKYQTKAYLIAPIFQGKKLWGLLGAYQNDSVRNWQESEADLMLQIANQLAVAIQQAEYINQLKQQAELEALTAERAKATATIINKVRQAQDIATIFKVTTQEMRRALQTDRVVIYQFNPDWSGKVIAESVGAGWVSLLVEQEQDEVLTGDRIQTDRCLLRDWSAGEKADIVEPDAFLRETQGGRYTRGQKYTAVADIYGQEFPECYIQSLEKYQTKAYLIAPIFQGKKLWGLLGAYQNDGVRNWQESEADLMLQIANQLAVAIQQAELIEQIKTSNRELAERSARETGIIQFSAQLVSRLAGLAQADSDSQEILAFATRELRQVLQADRVGVFRFDAEWMGEFVVESVGDDWLKLVGTDLAQVQDTYLKENKGGRYVNRESVCVNDIYEAGHNECHIALLEKWGTKAYAIAPIFKGEKLWGLLGMYQNDQPRTWETFEMAILEQVATQIGVTLQLAEYLNQVRSQEQQLSEAAERERKEKEKLQQGALKVLVALEPSFQGDLTVRAPLSDDEIGTIADGYNTTIQNMREIVRQVQVTATRVNETSSSNTSSIKELSEKAQQQLERLELASQELQQMVKATQEVMTNAQQVEQAVQEANRIVLSGDSLMEKTVDGILEMRETTAETAKKMKKLGEASQKISKIVNLIENFATQTNLLSLNAAIEATRAGEYGKGFAVVADEVRSLAYQSANATTEIERLVEEIQTEINEVNSAMELGITQVVQGSNLVNETRQSLSEIVLATEQISQLVTGITQATVSQNQQSESLTSAMTDVSAIANQTFASSSQISTSFAQLLETSEELQTSVSKFKVD